MAGTGAGSAARTAVAVVRIMARAKGNFMVASEITMGAWEEKTTSAKPEPCNGWASGSTPTLIAEVPLDGIGVLSLLNEEIGGHLLFRLFQKELRPQQPGSG